LPRLFGTDGVRGVANAELTPELAFRLGRAGAHHMSRPGSSPVVLVGRDTRASGDMIEAALVAGICSAGGTALRVGVMTTPGVAFLTRTLGADCGVVISASHNPVEYNGIKFFGPDGFKLLDEEEDEVQRLVEEDYAAIPSPTGADIGRARDLTDGRDRYVQYLVDLLGEGALEGLRVVLDCANGAASDIAPAAFSRAGAEVVPIHHTPDGLNINRECGSTHIAALQRAVVEHGAHVGLAFDGDADRVLAVDEGGEVVDGDRIIALLALDMKERGTLKGDAVVVTVMSNLGLEVALRERGIDCVRTQVGDRYVLAEMQERGLNLGGEQSGHVILLDHATTGDGLVTGLVLLAVLRRRGVAMSELAEVFHPLPQVLVNVRVRERDGLEEREAIRSAVERARRALEPLGRVFIRPSGTEPVVRVLVEGEDESLLRSLAEDIARAVEAELGGDGMR